VSVINLPLTAGRSKRARHPLAKATNRPSLPFHEPSFPPLPSEEKPCIYKDLAVKYAHKINGSAECANTQLSLFNHSAMSHDMADSPSLCLSTLGESKRRMMQTRQIRGLEIVSQSERQITYNETFWAVPSQTTGKTYAVTIDPPYCTCPDYKKTAIKCKHVFAVEYHIAKESGAMLPEVPEQKPKKTYKQDWPAYTQAQVNEKSKLLELLFALCEGVEDTPQHMGRPRISLADRIFATVFKVYECRSGRRFMSDLRDARQRGYVSRMAHFNSISRYIESEELTPILKQLIVESSLPLKEVEWDFAVDSSGFSTGVYKKWSDAKWGSARTVYGEKVPNEVNRRDWMKAHIMCGVKTNIVTSVEITDAHAGDSPRFRSLVETTAQGFPIQSVMADKGYSAEKNLKLVLLNGGQPYIAFRSNATASNRRSGQVWKRLFLQYQYNQEWFMDHYHKRSNVETTFSMIKRKFGERLRTKTETAQKNELLCKILCHNICVVIQSMYELGITPSFLNEEQLGGAL
jgi:transposase